MVRRTELIDEIRVAARARGMSLGLHRHRGEHDTFDLDGLLVPIPRHREIAPRTARSIRIRCEAWLGRRWWR